MSILDIPVLKESVMINDVEVQVAPIGYMDLMLVWNRYKEDMINAYNKVVAAEDNDPLVIFNALLDVMPEALIELIATSVHDGSVNKSETIEKLQSFPLGTLAQLGMAAYRVTMSDADVLKKSLSEALDKLKTKTGKTPMPATLQEQVQAIQAQ